MKQFKSYLSPVCDVRIFREEDLLTLTESTGADFNNLNSISANEWTFGG